jgi:hypothetical protein
MAVANFPLGILTCAIPFMWLWLIGMNYLIALARFDRFMKRCIREAGFSISAKVHF